MKINFYRPLLLTLGLGLAIVIGLKLSLSALTNPSNYTGCPALTTTGEIDPSETVAIWQNRSLLAPVAMIDSLSAKEKRILGTTSEEKWIEIDLSEQKLIAHQGNTIFIESLISSGLWNKTPVGEFSIWYKIRSTKMEGGSRLNNTYYYLPNVPYDMFFNDSYGIHGTYWHSNFGNRMSHGCVNAPTPVAEKLFYWTDPQLPPGKNLVRSSPTNPGTRVVIHD
jgi:lipoprotein-anchoring transpeptidase ErfK/SrfK